MEYQIEFTDCYMIGQLKRIAWQWENPFNEITNVTKYGKKT